MEVSVVDFAGVIVLSETGFDLGVEVSVIVFDLDVEVSVVDFAGVIVLSETGFDLDWDWISVDGFAGVCNTL